MGAGLAGALSGFPVRFSRRLLAPERGGGGLFTRRVLLRQSHPNITARVGPFVRTSAVGSELSNPGVPIVLLKVSVGLSHKELERAKNGYTAAVEQSEKDKKRLAQQQGGSAAGSKKARKNTGVEQMQERSEMGSDGPPAWEGGGWPGGLGRCQWVGIVRCQSHLRRNPP